MKKLIVGIFLVILLCLCMPIQVEAVNGNTEEFDYVFGEDVPFETTYEFHNYKAIGNILCFPFVLSTLLAFIFYNRKVSVILLIISFILLSMIGIFWYLI